MIKKYYSMEQAEKEASIYIFGDITSWRWDESDVSSFTLSKQLLEMGDVDTVHVYINSYGGEVAEGLAIYNALRRHKAKVITYCEGLVCSIASVIFMAGDERIMSNASSLMIHNAWTECQGDANALRKTADDLDTITRASINAYLNHINIEEEELIDLLDKGTWLTYDEALEKGFATSVVQEKSAKVSQSIKKSLFNMIIANQKANDELKLEESEMEERKIEEEPKNKTAQIWDSFFNALREE